MYKGKRVNAIVQARMGSTRLPGKVLLDLAGKPVLSHVVDRLSHSEYIDDIIVATSKKSSDDKILEWANDKNISIFRGSEEDVLGRFYDCYKENPADVICRITADCPLVDYKLMDEFIEILVEQSYDCVHRSDKIPRGVTGEVIKSETLLELQQKARKDYQREHVTYYIYEDNGDEFSVFEYDPPGWLSRDYRLTLDEEEDYKLFKVIFKNFKNKSGYIQIKSVLELLDQNL